MVQVTSKFFTSKSLCILPRFSKSPSLNMSSFSAKCFSFFVSLNSTLRKWVEAKFSEIASDKNVKSELAALHEQRASAYRLGHETAMRYFIESISEQRQITYFWSISGLDLHESYRSPVLQLINSHLVESAATDSLFDILKNQLMFIEGIDSEVFYDEKKWTGTSISFQLTAAGEEHVDLVSFYLLKYLNLLLVTARNNKKLDKVYGAYFEETKCIDSLYFEHYALLKRERTYFTLCYVITDAAAMRSSD